MTSPVLTTAAVFATTGVVWAFLAGWQILWVRTRWIRAGRSLKLDAQHPFWGIPTLSGAIDGVPVNVRGDAALPARASALGIPPELAFFANAFGSAPKESTGDPEFDRGTRASSGDRPDVLAALLDPSTRELIWKFVSAGGTVSLGSAEISGARSPETAESIALAARRTARVAAVLARPLDVPAGLGHNAVHDPVDGVRERCLRFLVERHSGEIAAATCRALLRDVSPSIRLIAAAYLRAEGLGCLLDLVLDPGTPAEIAVKAIAHAAAAHSPETAEGVFAVLTAGFNSAPELRAQAIHSAARIQWWEGIAPAFEDELVVDPLTITSLATGLARFPRHIAETEPYLLALLKSTDHGVRRAAVKTLEEIGTVAAVASLLPLTQGVLGDAQVQTMALKAIRAIQARQSGAGAGQLSLGENAEEGKLDLVTTGGELAMASEAGSVALSPEESSASEPPRPQAKKTTA